MDKYFELGQKLYFQIGSFRDRLFGSLLKLLCFLKITPNAVTFFGVFLMLSFILLIPFRPITASIFLALAVFADLTDGALARHTKKQSDKGKFIDMSTDILVFALFIGGIINGHLIPGMTGFTIAFALFFSKAFRIIYNARFLYSDWHFRAVAGFTPNLFTNLLYLLFVIYAFSGENFLPIASIIFSALLFLDAMFYSQKIILLKR